MPATSRSGRSGARRSATGRSGSPSKSSTTQPRSGTSSHLPQVRSPWTRCSAGQDRASNASMRAVASARSGSSSGAWARAACRRVRNRSVSSCRWVWSTWTVPSAVASSACTWATDSPRRRARLRNFLPRAAERRATRHASSTSPRYSLAKARCPRRSSPVSGSGHDPSTAPSGVGMTVEPCRASSSWSSTSGFAPTCTTRNSLTIAVSRCGALGRPPRVVTMMEVFDCSPGSTREPVTM
ncbi:hypothetical protein BJF82_00990 [Kytococcus sp. CUA-901]|nr:hypothetical protein BJF82_00990 [Kytococcus sp. CUA-901]